ncbi:Asp23/Gls24 family envelope stress response protein [Saccharopolyspora tripterygii]
MSAPAEEKDAGERGSLEIDRAVLRKIAEHAASGVSGVARTRRGPNAKLTGPDEELRIRLDLPVRYPEPVRDTVRAVRGAVSEELTRLAGAGVLNVEVTVSALVPAARRNRVE